MSQSRLRCLASFVLAAVLVAVPTTALAARPVEQFHDHFTDTFRINDFCGFRVDAVVVVTDNFFVYADDTFKDTSSVRQRLTNVANGKTVIVASAGQVTGTTTIDEQAGTITFATTFRGLPERIQAAHGPVLVRDAGLITFSDTFDLESGDLISSDVVIKGPHPEAESDFELFCDVVSDVLA